ncbi:Plug domain-containing protein [Sphingopyxis sp. PET50]|uniref:Plug domain-containing protein n=1 Tax=Sphingopyxis sp. PET50 TaxID=2976533 RepID=UPI0021B04AD1|nr:Plug domain-containing protein [Sphingopyxis sp. PET50]
MRDGLPARRRARRGGRTPACGSAADEEESGIIVVTAQRREERLIDVPASVTAIGQDRIQATGAQDVGDLGSYVPNVVIADGTGLGSAVAIRGVGSNSRNIGFDSRVGVYLDGVYLGQSPAMNQQLVDIERVEVLRGPQGALFGKNTVAERDQPGYRQADRRIFGLCEWSLRQLRCLGADRTRQCAARRRRGGEAVGFAQQA